MIAQYYYKEYDLNTGLLVPQKCLVEILKNNNKTYLVRLLNFCRGYEPGKEITVHKKNIKL